MPSRVQFQMTEAEEREERKRRQEKFRKRTGSLFNKVRLLAKDTDAWVTLIVRDRSGRIQSFRSSDNFNWPPSIKDLIVGRRFSSSKILYANRYQRRKILGAPMSSSRSMAFLVAGKRWQKTRVTRPWWMVVRTCWWKMSGQ